MTPLVCANGHQLSATLEIIVDVDAPDRVSFIGDVEDTNVIPVCLECGGAIDPDVARRVRNLVVGATEAIPDEVGVRVCRACGCTTSAPCAGGCGWVAYDLCSACVEKPTAIVGVCPICQSAEHDPHCPRRAA